MALGAALPAQSGGAGPGARPRRGSWCFQLLLTPKIAVWVAHSRTPWQFRPQFSLEAPGTAVAMRPSALRAAARRTRPLPGRPYRPSSYRPAAHHPQAPHPPPLTLPPLPPPPPPAAAYVHLPFCVRRCHYCDFPVVALGARAAVGVAPAVAGATVGGRAVGRAGGGGGDSALPPPRPPVLDRYLDALLAEIRAAGEREGGRVGPPLGTVSFGGGTPSLVPPPDIARLLASLDAAFGIAPDAEARGREGVGGWEGGRRLSVRGNGVQTEGENGVCWTVHSRPPPTERPPDLDGGRPRHV